MNVHELGKAKLEQSHKSQELISNKTSHLDQLRITCKNKVVSYRIVLYWPFLKGFQIYRTDITCIVKVKKMHFRPFQEVIHGLGLAIG